MRHFTRRRLLVLAGASVLGGRWASGPTPLRFLLNSGYSSVNAWFCLADDRGYLHEAGLQLAYTAGRGAYTAAARTAEEGFDIGYGDVYALVELRAASEGRAPVAVYMMFNRSPSVVAVPAASAIRVPGDLNGRHLRGHATDVALQTFPTLAARTGVEARSVRISTSEAGMGELAADMLRGVSDGIFGYESTIVAALITAQRPVDSVRFFSYRELVPELYGSALMVSPRLIREQPSLVAGLVGAVNRGVADAIADPTAAIEAVRKRSPGIIGGAERARLMRTLAGEMSHPEGARLGIGAIDPRRFGAGVRLLCESKALAKVPAVSEIWSDAFPVPRDARITQLAARA